MTVPLVARAQVQMLAEGFLEAIPAADALPVDLQGCSLRNYLS